MLSSAASFISRPPPPIVTYLARLQDPIGSVESVDLRLMCGAGKITALVRDVCHCEQDFSAAIKCMLLNKQSAAAQAAENDGI